MTVTFVIGGARSGKSSFAERYTAQMAQGAACPVVYVATAEALDEEMAGRIALHRDRRPPEWTTIEEPVDIPKVLRSLGNACAPYPLVMIDCLSLLLSNWLWMQQDDGLVQVEAETVESSDVSAYPEIEALETAIRQRAQALVVSLQDYPGHAVVVSNEVGAGIVPANPMTRLYRDHLGWLNQRVASLAASAFLVVAGIPVDLRKLEATW